MQAAGGYYNNITALKEPQVSFSEGYVNNLTTLTVFGGGGGSFLDRRVWGDRN